MIESRRDFVALSAGYPLGESASRPAPCDAQDIVKSRHNLPVKLVPKSIHGEHAPARMLSASRGNNLAKHAPISKADTATAR